jgi:hypothetical protein
MTSIAYADVSAAEFQHRVSCLSDARPHHPQIYNHPMGAGGFGLNDDEIWNLASRIIVRVQATLKAGLLKLDLPAAYPPAAISGGDLGVFDSDLVDRLVKGLKKAGYTIVTS